MTGFEGIGDFDSSDPYQRYIAHQAAKGGGNTMPTVTTRGRKFADTLKPLIGSSREIDVICSRICRLETTHHRLAEDECNIPMSEEQQKKHEDHVEVIEEQITSLVEQLPETPDGPLTVFFQGDPRGCTVKLLINNLERHPAYNGWALEAIIVP